MALQAALICVTPTVAGAAPTWMTQTSRGAPVASITLGGVGVMVLCDARGASYTMMVTGPPAGVRAGRGIKGEVRGARTVKLRFDNVRIDERGLARLTTSGGARGSVGDQSGALYAIEAMRTARSAITVVAGPFAVTVPHTGAEAALAPLVRACGSPKTLGDRARQREYGD